MNSDEIKIKLLEAVDRGWPHIYLTQLHWDKYVTADVFQCALNLGYKPILSDYHGRKYDLIWERYADLED